MTSFNNRKGQVEAFEMSLPSYKIFPEIVEKSSTNQDVKDPRERGAKTTTTLSAHLIGLYRRRVDISESL